MTLQRVAIVNRGEAAMRFIQAAAELQRAGEPIITIALCTEAERHAMFVREADEFEVIGSEQGIAYLDYEELARALLSSRADAVWVGWGFVAEHPDFADLCDRLGVTFIGPSGDVMRKLGDKIGAKRIAEEVGAPVAAWSGGPVTSATDALDHAERIGFPLLIKATAGGGGRGIRFVDRAEDLPEAFERASLEAERSFGDATVFMERRLTDARHIEVQVAADVAGNVWAVGVRDCSVQRRNQKVLEESHSPVLTATQQREVAEAARAIIAAVDYRNVGTVEFLYQPSEASFAFLEVNTRLQVEHPVTELTTGIDLVKLQLHLAAGGLLEGNPPPTFGHAIEARLNAEDPQRGFAPAPGRIDHLHFGNGPGIRIDTGVATGDVIPSDYDAMVAKIIAWGESRDEARIRLMRALDQTAVAIQGGTTNKSFLLDVLERSPFVEGSADTAWLDRLTAAGEHLPDRHGEVALVIAAIDAWEQEMALDRVSFSAWAARGRPQTDARPAQTFELRHGGQRYELSVGATGPGRFRMVLDGTAVNVDHERMTDHESRLQVGDRRFRISSRTDADDHLVEVEGVAHRVSRDSGGLVRAPAPALVVSVAVETGAEVSKGDLVAVLESMKMETAVVAPVSGRVREVLVTANTQIDAGAPILRLEPDDADEETQDRQVRLDLATLVQTPPASADTIGRCLELLDAMRWLVLGFDAGDDPTQLLDEYQQSRNACDPTTAALIEAELAVLDAFADVSALSRNRPEAAAEPELHSPEAFFHRYLRSLDVDTEGLPESFRTKLVLALAQLGVIDLERSPALERAAHQIFIAQQVAIDRRPIVLTLLGRQALPVEDLSPELTTHIRATLDKFIAATQVRHPSLGDQARSLRFRTFDEPAFERSRQAVMTAMRGHLDTISSQRGSPDDHRDALVRCPYPLVGLLADHEPGSGFDGLAPLLEVLTVRNYRIRVIEAIDRSNDGPNPVLVARYRRPDDDAVLHTVATLAEAAKLTEALTTIASHSATITTDGRIVADVYVALDDKTPDSAALAARMQAALDQVQLPPQLDRLAVSASSSSGIPVGATFRRAGDAWTEDRPVRGIHPLIAVRLGLWRLRQDFTIEPVAARPGTHLFRAVAADNPRDERLYAAGEVRDLAAELDTDGRVVGLAGLEQVYTACIDGLRRAQADRPDNRRLFWNRIHLYVWESVDFSPHDAAFVVNLLEPLGRGLGIEEVGIQVRLGQGDGTYREQLVRITPQAGGDATLRVTDVPTRPIRPVNDYERRVVMSRQRGAVYPYELVAAIARPSGTFTEYDLDGQNTLAPVTRQPGENTAGIVAGVASTPTDRYPEGMQRVVLIGDPTKSLGSLAEQECRLVIGALDLAEREGLPVEWFSLSSGARIAMDSGTENMDWIAAALRRIVTFTQGGGEINVVVTGINVGAQPYWNAEATMLQHTRGILVMTPDSAMVLTGKQALDISGGVSAEDNFGIGGYDRIMGPNGQAQYFAPDLASACEVLFAHYDHGYRAPGERFPRRDHTEDPFDRDISDQPHAAEGADFTTVGQIFSDEANPGRKKPFDIRAVIRGVIDQDHAPLERWAAMADAETAVVFDAKLGGIAHTLVGIESRPLPRHGGLPADGPDQWTAGTLFPKSSKKVARAINAASGSRPLLFLANLSGFDGSPESLRGLQLEYGAEIGRAIVNFDGPIVFCVVSRYHGGAFVVFSSALHDNMQVLAVEGTHASVLGGAPAAAVVFAGEVNRRVLADPRVVDLQTAVEAARGDEAAALAAQLAATTEAVRSETLGQVAEEFDAVHSIERAQEVGSVDEIVPAKELRPRLITALERGMGRA